MTIGSHAMILAAGKGLRMGDLSDTRPKPLTEVLEITLLDRILVHLHIAEVKQVVVNVHHLADQIEDHLASEIAKGYVQISDERDGLLETGGGVKRALPLLGHSPFFVINGDALWVDRMEPNLARLRDTWDADKMDVLLLLVARDEALGYEGVGDFLSSEAASGESRETDVPVPLAFRGDAPGAPYVFGGVQVIHPRLYDDMPGGVWSNREVFRKAAAAGRLYGLPIDGHWMHVGTKEAIAAAEKKLLAIRAS